MKPWYDDIDVATLQRIKTYSAFCDYKSQNLMLQTLYEAMQKKIDEYKQTNRGIAKDYADLQKQVKELQQENAELKEKISYLEDNLRVARKDRENLQLDVAKGLKEFVKDYPATALRYLANEKYVEQFTKAKDIIRDLLSCLYSVEYDRVSDLEQAEQFLQEVKE